MAVLMLCNTPVYDISSRRLLSAKLFPVYNSIDSEKDYKRWRKHRSYIHTNRTSEQIVANTADTRVLKRRLSLSDGYWTRHDYDRVTTFEAITPYSNPFDELYPSPMPATSVPAYTVGGSQSKMWKRIANGTYLAKVGFPEQLEAELAAIKLAHYLKIPCMQGFIAEPSYIALSNITSPKKSLIHFDQMGIMCKGTDPQSVIQAYKQAGVKARTTQTALVQVLFDAVVGNLDRETNTSNWGILMDTRTGARTPSPLYDFNLANLYAPAIHQLSHVAGFIRKAGFIAQSLRLLSRFSFAAQQLGYTCWRENTDRLFALLQ